ncbi:MAG: histidine kinase [Bacteroidota bacterium]
MKSKINIWLPIALSAALPGVGFITNRNSEQPYYEGDFTPIWIITSLFLYTLWHVLWQLWDFKKKYTNKRYQTQLVVLLLILIGIIYIQEKIGPAFDQERVLTLRILLASVIHTTIQFALKNQARISQLKLQTEQLQTENYKAQLNTIRAQIDPHFLFNSLNTLRAMVRQAHPKSEQFVISLSDFYRNSLQQNSQANIKLSEEIDLLESYLFVMQSRNEKSIIINMNIDEKYHHAKIPSMALQQVVENCFKHNVMTTKNPLHIDISTESNGYIEVSNNLRPTIEKPISSGYGLDLLRKRYELMGISNGVVLMPSESHFIVKLKLI